MRFTRRGKRPALFLAVLMLAVYSLALGPVAGCSEIAKAMHPAKVAPGQDAVAVHAEQTVRATFTLADTFVGLDDANRELFKTNLPTVHAAAESLRTSGPTQFRNAWAAVRAYEAAPSIANAKTLDEQLANLDKLAAQLRGWLGEVNSKNLVLNKPTATALPDQPAAP